MGKKNCTLTLPVITVVCGIMYIYITTIFVFIDRWFGLSSSPGLVNAFIFTLIAFISIFNYVLAVFTDPGRVPVSFSPDVEDSDIHEVKRKSGDLRYCQKCSHYKPPRAHHCRVCKRCVLRMDHHCIWINNCVGHANYKIFFVFVLYAVIACVYSLVRFLIYYLNPLLFHIRFKFLVALPLSIKYFHITLPWSLVANEVLLMGSIISDAEKDEPHNEGNSRTIYVISCLLLFPLTIALGVLLVWHIYLILHNKTTIEYYEGVRAMWLAAKGGEVYRHPYDLGTFENLTSVLGRNILSWICPTTSHIGQGLRFPTAYDKLTEPTSE